MKTLFSVCAISLLPLLAACETGKSTLPVGQAAYSVIPSSPSAEQRTYAIGPLDVINVTVFKEPDLSLKEVQVDATGNIVMPLVGSFHAAGKSTSELSTEIAARLDKRYLVDPQVSVTVTASVSQRVTVEGSVNKPGVVEISGSLSLLEALANAGSPNRTARLDQVAVFRIVDGHREGALFDVNKVRKGQAEDPQLRGGDVVVVGYSSIKGAFRDLLSSAPLIGLFTRF